MIFTDLQALRACTALIALASLLQSTELLALRETTSDHGIWRWKTLRQDFSFFPEPMIRVFDLLLGYSGFGGVLWTRWFLSTAVLALSLASVEVPFVLLALLLITTVLVLLRWRGTFNGGSDFMTLVVLLALTAAQFDPDSEKLRRGALWYIAIQTCASYFISGVIKLRKKNWRTGKAVPGFLASSFYETPRLVKRALTDTPAGWLFSLLFSWATMIFECMFPLSLLNPLACGSAVAGAILFHLSVFFLFGLNRFLFAWMSAYPALYFCSQMKR